MNFKNVYMRQPTTLFDKIWDNHTVRVIENGPTVLYIDRHYIHEVTSPQAFEGMRFAKRKLWRADSNIAVPDHNIPTKNRKEGIKDATSKLQVDMLDRNCEYFEIPEFKMTDPNQGIVHIVGPEQGLTLPGMIEDPGSFGGITISPIPLLGPEAKRRISFAILLRETANCLRAPWDSTIAS